MCPNAVVGDTGEGGNIQKSIPGVLRFRTNEPEGESCMFAMLGMCGRRTGCISDSSRHSEQLSCRKLFHPSYGLFYMSFQSFQYFLEFLIKSKIIAKYYVYTAKCTQQGLPKLTCGTC